MNIGFWLCGVLVIPFVIIGVLFAIFKEKAAKFVSGFNSLPKEEQALYDKAHISRDKHRFWRPTRVFSSQSAVSCFSYGNLYSKGN